MLKGAKQIVSKITNVCFKGFILALIFLFILKRNRIKIQGFDDINAFLK